MSLMAERVRVLEMIARNEPLPDTLDLILTVLASHVPEVPSAIFLADNDAVSVGARKGFTGDEADEVRRAIATRTLPLASALDVRSLASAVGERLGWLALRWPSAPPQGETESIVRGAQALTCLAIEHRNLFAELTYRVGFDSLTHLGNRSSFEERLADALSRCRANQACVAVVSLNLNRFRLINEVLGNRVGDFVLQKVALRLSGLVQPTEFLARTGNDEFQLLLPDLTSDEDVAARAREMLDAVHQPIEVNAHELLLTASAAACTSLTAGDQPQEFQSKVYSAVETAKRRGPNSLAVYDGSMVTASPERLELEQHLRSAIQKRELAIHFQPQVSLATGEVVGCEVLLRWRHPSLGFVSPGRFIPIAEETGLIDSLSEWAAERCFEQMRAWDASGLTDMRVAINISPFQFARPDLATRLAAQIKRSGIDPCRLELEITESAVMQDIDLAREHIGSLQAIGVSFLLDDFGTGHSSLAHLQSLPVQGIKIDQAFTKTISSLTDRPPLLVSILSLASALEVRTVVEGVETGVQARVLTAMGCGDAQGFLFSKALPGAEFQKWLAARRSGAIDLYESDLAETTD